MELFSNDSFVQLYRLKFEQSRGCTVLQRTISYVIHNLRNRILPQSRTF